MSERINNPHDKGYKLLLSSEKIFLELLESFVDSGWVQAIDPESITKIDKSYILPDFQEKEADLVYQMKLNDQETIFYILMELQSTVDFQMPYRLLLYMVEVWRDILKNTEKNEAGRKDFKLPVIVPIVLYNGAGNWTACQSFKEMLSGAELFQDYFVDFRYILIDVNRYDKQSLIELANLVGVVFLLDQAIDQDERFKRLIQISDVLEKLHPQGFTLFSIWFKNVVGPNLPEKTKEEVFEIIDQSNPKEAKRMISNMAESFRKTYEEAVGKGKLEGKIETAKNMLAENMPDELIAKVTGLSLEKIKALKKEDMIPLQKPHKPL